MRYLVNGVKVVNGVIVTGFNDFYDICRLLTGLVLFKG